MFHEKDFVYSTGESAASFYPGSVYAVAPCLPKVVIEKLRPDIITPTYASEGDSGLDVYAPETLAVLPSSPSHIGLGFRVCIPKHPLHDFGYRWELQVRPRSGSSAHTMLEVVLGSVDNFYRGEVAVIIHNTAALQYSQGVEDKVLYTVSDYPKTLRGVQDPNIGSDRVFPEGTYIIRKGERFAQLVFNEVIRPLEIIEGKVDDTDTDRGSGGFGSTGV